MSTLADLCTALFSPDPDEMDIAARFGTTVEHVHAFYSSLSDLGLVVLEDRITGTWTRTTKAARTLPAFVEQVRLAGIDVGAPLE